MAKKKGGKDKAEVKEVKAPLKPNGMTEDEFVLYNDVNELVVQLRGGGAAEPLVSRVRVHPLAACGCAGNRNPGPDKGCIRWSGDG
jgi:hypothetical protein